MGRRYIQRFIQHCGLTPFRCRDQILKNCTKLKLLQSKNETCKMSVRKMSRCDGLTGIHNLSLLEQRGAIEVHGRDTVKLLQGLVTNDINLLVEEQNSNNRLSMIHSYILDAQGRIVFDIFIYKSNNSENSFLIECDKNQCENLIAHLRRYKLRSKVQFDHRPNLNIYTLLPNIAVDSYSNAIPMNTNAGLNIESGYFERIFSKDLRLPLLGYRALNENSPKEFLQTLEENSIKNVSSDGKYNSQTFHADQPNDEKAEIISTGNRRNIRLCDQHTYKLHRFRLGIAEGCNEVNNGIPLEYNAALLSSVNFDKGCYVGQELVSRAHFTGVIRKRVQPIQLSITGEQETPIAKSLIEDNTIYNPKNKRVGKLLNFCEQSGHGIGLMRLKETLESSTPTNLYVKSTKGNIHLITHRPFWWPSDLKY